MRGRSPAPGGGKAGKFLSAELVALKASQAQEAEAQKKVVPAIDS